jgi:predicted dehydrogenase
VDACFHNAYGPDKEWFYDPQLSGGGCVIDLGVHIVDLVRWVLDFPEAAAVHARVLHHGFRPVEDYAVATVDLATGAVVTLACSWNLPLGKPADLRLTFYGTTGAVAVRNEGSSYTACSCELWRGTTRERLVEAHEGWEGGALCAWAARVAEGERFDDEAEQLVETARILDEIGGVSV